MTLAPPARTALAALDDDTWARLVGHARRVLRDLDDAERDALGDIASATTVQLLSGAGREALAAELAAGGPLWDGVAARLHEDGADEWEQRLAPTVSGNDADGSAVAVAEAVDAATRPLRDRIRELTQQRDAARRQAEGADARARSAEAKLRSATDELDDLRSRVDDLSRQVAEAADVRQATLDRQRRQHEAEIASLRDEVRDLRRAEQERHEERRRREEAEEAAARAEREAEEVARRARRTGRQVARPGRPTRLPRDVQPGTLAAARALLTGQHLVLVDGYNLTLKHRGHLGLEQQRAALIATLEAAAARFRCDFEVLFDSRHGSPPAGGSRSRTVRVRFTAPGVTADDEIVFEVSAQPEQQPILVVTDDRELQARVRPYAVDVLSTSEFLRAVE